MNRMNQRLQQKINILRLFTEQSKFNYLKPYMSYDKETGDVTIIEGKDLNKKQAKIINSVEDHVEERKKLFKELGLDERGRPLKDDLDDQEV